MSNTTEQARALAATVRDRLAKISHDEPWTQPRYGGFGWYVSGPAGAPEFDDSDQGKVDAQFVADAPALLAGLAEAVETLTAQLDGLNGAIDGAIQEAAGKHRPDRERGGCTCGFCAWSPEHVAIMALREATGRG